MICNQTRMHPPNGNHGNEGTKVMEVFEVAHIRKPERKFKRGIAGLPTKRNVVCKRFQGKQKYIFPKEKFQGLDHLMA